MLRSFLFLTAVAAAAHAADLLPSYPAVEPKDVAKTFRVKNGFTMDLIAAEPLVSSPVAIAYDENGAAYVVEMRDYPIRTRTRTRLMPEGLEATIPLQDMADLLAYLTAP